MSEQIYPAAHPQKMEPVHPGAIIKRALEHENVSVQQAAVSLGVSRQSLYRVINGVAAVSPEMAVRLGAFIGNGPRLWLQMQVSYDIWHAMRLFDVDRKVVPISLAAKGMTKMPRRQKRPLGAAAKRERKPAKARVAKRA